MENKEGLFVGELHSTGLYGEFLETEFIGSYEYVVYEITEAGYCFDAEVVGVGEDIYDNEGNGCTYMVLRHFNGKCELENSNV